MVSANWQQWSRFGESYDDTYGAGVALSYQFDSWTLHSGFSADTSPLSSDDRGYALPLDQQWRLGIGAEKKLKNGMNLGLAYQYQSLGDAEITGNSGLPNGEYSNNRVHFITGSLSF
jgi:long-chain fatty acid transport protein